MPLVVVTGCDGAGKSTVLNLLCGRSGQYQQAHWSDFARKLGIEQTAATLIREMRPATRAFFLLLLNWGLSEQIIEPKRLQGETVICESYYFKFLAKERVYNLARRSLVESLGSLPPPDLIVDVTVDPNVAFARLAHKLNSYETLSGSGSREDFRQLQDGIRRELGRIVADFKVPVLTIDGACAADANAAMIDAWIRDHLGQMPPKDPEYA